MFDPEPRVETQLDTQEPTETAALDRVPFRSASEQDFERHMASGRRILKEKHAASSELAQ